MRKIDLNLLYTLEVLLNTKSTTLAAQELKTSQSAVSRSLNKIREIMNDQLLVRKGQSLELTVKGLQIQRDLWKLMPQVHTLFHGEKFQPCQCDEKITIAINASIAEWVVSAFVNLIAQLAPNIELTIDDWDSSTPILLDQGKVRMGVNYFPLELPKSFIQRKIGADSFVLVCRADHPLNQHKSIATEHLQQSEFAVHIMKDWNDVAPRAERYGITLNVKLRCRHLSIILRALLESDLVLFCPYLTAVQLDERFVSLPITDDGQIPNSDIGLFYSNHLLNDPLTLWLENQLKEVIKKISS